MKTCKKLFLLVFFITGTVASGQSKKSLSPVPPAAPASVSASQQLQMPQMPSMPQMAPMPSVSAPSLGNNFYTPGTAGFYQGRTKVPASSPDNSTAETQSPSGISTPASASSSILTAAGLSEINTGSSLSSIVSAQDLASMDSMGILGSLIGNRLGQNTISSDSNSLTLQQILKELNDLKKTINEKPDLASTSSVHAVQHKGGQQILRFLVNGQNLIPGCHTVYFSKPEQDGSFLLTGDRRYSFNNRQYNETFHLLFKAAGTKQSSVVYNVSPALTQEVTNTSSAFYKLSQIKNLTAEKTGNLVTLKHSDLNLRADILLALE